MALFEEVTLTESIEIKTTPEKIFEFLSHIVDDESYRAWHPEDHVALRWIKGEPFREGSVVYAEEYIHGKLHKLKFVITKVVPNRRIEFAPQSRLLRIYFPKNVFEIEQKGDTCLLTTTGRMRVGRLVKIFAKKQLEAGLASVRKHMKEEGENLKRILEAQG
ncbi:MAG: SRPBCC family protein [Phycisphaerales bacterium]|nr:MAG: SRPBCC family protein [Phycisphaerales bacterium]